MYHALAERGFDEEFDGMFVYDKNSANTCLFLEPGQKAPNNLAAELFSDGSFTPGSKNAGWGLWGVFLESASGVPRQIVEAFGPVVTKEIKDDTSDLFIGADKASNITGELTGLYKAFCEIQKLPSGSVCLVRPDCIPAAMLAVGMFRAKKNTKLIDSVRTKWNEISTCYSVTFMHAKGHSDIYGNIRADDLADKGPAAVNDECTYRDVSDLGGSVRFSRLYHTADSGRDCDMEKKYAGKARTKKIKVFTKATSNRIDTIRKQLRTCGLEADKVAKIMTDINDARLT
jgi:ribonuclease HI